MSIPLILASQSRPRRDVLFSAGICPTIRVSHVDEPAALEREAAALGVTVNDLSVEQRVMILATAKAEAVHQAYRNIADTAAHARGERVVGFPPGSRRSRRILGGHSRTHGQRAVRRRDEDPRFLRHRHSHRRRADRRFRGWPSKPDPFEGRPADSRLRFHVPAGRRMLRQAA